MATGNTINTEAIRHYYRGRVFEAVGELDIAIEEYRKAIEYGADYADVHNSLGRVLAKKGFFEEARIEFENALRLNPRYLEAQKNLNELLTKISLATQQKNITDTSFIKSPGLQVKEEIKIVENEEEKKYYEKLYKKKIIQATIIYGAISLAVMTLVVIGYKKFSLEHIPIQKIYDTKMETISSISRYDNKIVLSCWSSQEINIFRAYKDNISIVTSFKFDKENIVPHHICVLENNLYILDAWGKKIYRCRIINNKPVITKVVDVSQNDPLGLAGYRDCLLLFDTKSRNIVVYNKELNRIIETIPYIIKDIICVSSFNNKIWLLDNNYTIYKLKGYREIIKSYKLDFAVGRRISSFLIDDKFLWFVEEGSPHLYCYSKNIFE